MRKRYFLKTFEHQCYVDIQDQNFQIHFSPTEFLNFNQTIF